MFHLPDDTGAPLSAPLVGLVVPCSHQENTFLPLWTRPRPSLSELKIFFKATITIERRTTPGCRASSRFFLHRLGLITHFPPVSKSAPNPTERARVRHGCSPGHSQTWTGPKRYRFAVPFGNFELKIGDYILSESAPWFHFAWGKVALRLSMVILKFPDGTDPHWLGMRTKHMEQSKGITARSDFWATKCFCCTCRDKITSLYTYLHVYILF